MTATHRSDFPKNLTGLVSLNFRPMSLLRKRTLESSGRWRNSALQFWWAVNWSISHWLTRIDKSSFSLWLLRSMKQLSPSLPNNFWEQSLQEREVVNSAETDGQDRETSRIKSDSNVWASTPPGKNVKTSLGFNSFLPLEIFNFSIRDLVRQKEHRLALTLLWLRAHLWCSSWLLQTRRDLVNEISFWSSASSVLANFGGLGFPPPLRFRKRRTDLSAPWSLSLHLLP